MTRRVWIDTDPAITSGNGEVDDGFALMQAFGSPELEIVGVSAVFGNTELDNTDAMAREIVRRAGRDVPVYRGHGVEGARDRCAAVEGLLQALEDGPLTIIALGPLTTVAAALIQPDARLKNVEEIVFVGGRRIGLEFRATPDQETPFRDLNFELDATAAELLLALGMPMTLAGWEVSSQMWLSAEDLTVLRQNGSAAVAWLAEASQDWLDRWVETFKAPGFTPFDTLAVGWLLCPELFDGFEAPAQILHTPERALFHIDDGLNGPRVRYLRSVDNQAFRADLMARLLSSGANG
ncbi:MAG: nucleoside hydrolase [Pseudomonadota bacterium]